MSAGELAWRLRASARDRLDRLRVRRRQRPRPPSDLLETGSKIGELLRLPTPGFRVTDMDVGEWAGSDTPEPFARWRQRLVARANEIAAGRLSYFDLVNHPHGDPIDWHKDHASGRQAPLIFSGSIDYRDFDQVGDCKYVWEPNRHHHLVVLARAYRATGDTKYARAVVAQLASWLDANPYGIGMNWRSPLELAVRLINWVYAVDMIRESGLLAGEVLARFLDAVHRHVWEIQRKYSQASSANNHLIGEAAGVFVATTYFKPMRGVSPWRVQSRDILRRAIVDQTYPDGGNREQAFGYHLFVLQFFLVAGLAARRAGEDFPSDYWTVLESMFTFAGKLAEGGPVPMYGDSDDGYVLDLDDGPADVETWLAVGAVLFKRADLRARAGRFSEPARWLLGREARAVYADLESPDLDTRITSHAFDETGLYLLQSGHLALPDRISVTVDGGELGFRSIAAHGHADALSITLRAFGREVFVDPGTYDYFTYPEWRTYFRSTRAHNTVEIDGEDQSIMLGPFMWGRRAECTVQAWQPNDHGGRIVLEHDGYARLATPAIHRRTVELDGPTRRVTIVDEIQSDAPHDVAAYFHLAEPWRASAGADNRVVWSCDYGTVELIFASDVAVEIIRGQEEPVGGWMSRAYHHKADIATIRAQKSVEPAEALRTEILISPVAK